MSSDDNETEKFRKLWEFWKKGINISMQEDPIYVAEDFETYLMDMEGLLAKLDPRFRNDNKEDNSDYGVSSFQREDFEDAGFEYDSHLTAQIGGCYNEWFYDPPKNQIFCNIILGCNYETGLVKIFTGRPDYSGNNKLFEGVIQSMDDLQVVWKCIEDARYLAYKEQNQKP